MNIKTDKKSTEKSKVLGVKVIRRKGVLLREKSKLEAELLEALRGRLGAEKNKEERQRLQNEIDNIAQQRVRTIEAEIAFIENYREN